MKATPKLASHPSWMQPFRCQHAEETFFGSVHYGYMGVGFMFKRVGWVVFSLVMATVGGLFLSYDDVAWGDTGNHGVLCVMDVVVESENQSGILIGKEVYHQEFLLNDGVPLFQEDFSTRTRLKFFTAALQTDKGESSVAINWFADVTVFNTVDLNTSVLIAKGNKSGQASGNNTVYTSNGSTRTTFTLSCLEN